MSILYKKLDPIIIEDLYKHKELEEESNVLYPILMCYLDSNAHKLGMKTYFRSDITIKPVVYADGYAFIINYYYINPRSKETLRNLLKNLNINIREDYLDSLDFLLRIYNKNLNRIAYKYQIKGYDNYTNYLIELNNEILELIDLFLEQDLFNKPRLLTLIR